MRYRRICTIILLAIVIFSTRAPADSWFDDFAGLRQAGGRKVVQNPKSSPRVGFGAKPSTWTLWVRTRDGGPLIASCPPYGDWKKAGKVLSVKGALFYEGRGARMRGRSAAYSRRTAMPAFSLLRNITRVSSRPSWISTDWIGAWSR